MSSADLPGGLSAGLGADLAAFARELERRGHAAVEVYEKRGRSRTFERTRERESMQVASEAGWAARAGDARRALFFAATGSPDPGALPSLLPDASAHPLLLPEARGAGMPVEPARESAVVAPLATESAAGALFDAIEKRLASELPGARILSARLDDGASEAALFSNRGVRARTASRAAWLRLEAERHGVRVVLTAAERATSELKAQALARRLADRLAALEATAGGEVSLSPAAFVLAAPLAARLVEALAPLWVGRGAEARLAPLLDGGGMLASERVTLVDDGRFAEAPLAADVDGEGMPTGRALLVEAGRFRSALLAWWEAPGSTLPGCARRASFRDLPRRAPTQLYLEPGEAAPGELVRDLADGVYLIDAEGSVELGRSSLEFSVPVSGFAIRAGEAPTPLGPRRLEGSLGALLCGVRAAARDLAFVPGDGMFGAATLLVAPPERGALRLRGGGSSGVR